MNDTKVDTLRVPGASLYYEVRGSGPVLLMIGAGAADAASFIRSTIQRKSSALRRTATMLTVCSPNFAPNRHMYSEVEFPSHHAGHVSHPRAFAEQLRVVLTAATKQEAEK